MKKLYALLLFFSCLWAVGLNAQTRYLQQVFANAEVTKNQIYGANATVLGYPTVFKQPLIMDVYRPASDTETKRPLIIYLHTGNFLPFISPIDGTPGFNGSCGGTIRDSAVIEACTRLAKMGYVVAAADYRLGWNPLASDDVQRRYGIINAAYRGVQDARTCVRYFKKTVKEGGNLWGIDTTKIVMFGQGTGGYIALAAVGLNNYVKVPTASDGKFLWDPPQVPGTDIYPMVIPQINGDIYGTSYGIAPNAAGTGVDTLCYPNHAGYGSSFALAVHTGGACADTAWLDPGMAPIISFQVPYDNFAPYGEGIVNVPGTNLQVVKVQGAYAVQQLIEKFGNNNAFIGKPISDLGSNQNAAFANTPIVGGNNFTDPTPGLYPIVKPLVTVGGNQIPTTTAPWEWSAPVPNNPTCNTNKASALVYWDTILRFYAPRACFALGLQPCIDQVLSGKEPQAQNIDVLAAPNPATDEIRFSSENEIRSIQIFDRTGRLVGNLPEVNSNNYTLQRQGLNAGLYVVKMSFKEGFVTKIVQFE